MIVKACNPPSMHVNVYDDQVASTLTATPLCTLAISPAHPAYRRMDTIAFDTSLCPVILIGHANVMSLPANLPLGLVPAAFITVHAGATIILDSMIRQRDTWRLDG